MFSIYYIYIYNVFLKYIFLLINNTEVSIFFIYQKKKYMLTQCVYVYSYLATLFTIYKIN